MSEFLRMHGGEMGPQVLFADLCGAYNTRNEDAPDILEINASRFRDEGKWNENAGTHGYENRDYVPNWDMNSKHRGGDKQPEEETHA